MRIRVEVKVNTAHFLPKDACEFLSDVLKELYTIADLAEVALHSAGDFWPEKDSILPTIAVKVFYLEGDISERLDQRIMVKINRVIQYYLTTAGQEGVVESVRANCLV